jgi:hypothetical protein
VFRIVRRNFAAEFLFRRKTPQIVVSKRAKIGFKIVQVLWNQRANLIGDGTVCGACSGTGYPRPKSAIPIPPAACPSRPKARAG